MPIFNCHNHAHFSSLAKGVFSVVLLSFICCTPGGVTTDTGTDSGLTSTEESSDAGTTSVTDETTDAGETEIGSIVTLPSKPTQNAIILESASITSSQTASSSDLPEGSLDCVPATKTGDEFGNEFEPQTQMCPINRAPFVLGILAVDLISCADAQSAETPCDLASAVTITARESLYLGDQIDVVVGEEPALFPAETTALADLTGFRAGGLQIVTSYIGHYFPATDTEPDEAKSVASYLRGKAYRICTTPEDGVDGPTMLTRCGHEEALQGDFLVDLDGDGKFGFFDINALAPDSGSETATRPENYSQYREHFLRQIFPSKTATEIRRTDGKTYAPGYAAPLFPFAAVTEIAEGEDRHIYANLYYEGTLRFMDGGRSAWDNGFVCVAAAIDGECDDDADPTTPGLFDPYFDFLPFVTLPLSSVDLADSVE